MNLLKYIWELTKQARLEAPKKGGAKIAQPNIEEDQTY